MDPLKFLRNPQVSSDSKLRNLEVIATGGNPNESGAYIHDFYTRTQYSKGPYRDHIFGVPNPVAIAANKVQVARGKYADVDDKLAEASGALENREDAVLSEMGELAKTGGPEVMAELMRLDALLKKVQRIQSLLSNAMNARHQTKKDVIQNIRV